MIDVNIPPHVTIGSFLSDEPERLMGLISNWAKKRAVDYLNSLYRTKYKINDIQYTCLGKPFINNPYGVEFSISHSSNCAVVVIANNTIGVDLEKVRVFEHYKIAKRFFTAREFEVYYESNNKECKFWEIWTKKEAYVKYLGAGISYGMRNFDVYDQNLIKYFFCRVIGNYVFSIFLLKKLTTNGLYLSMRINVECMKQSL